MYRNFWIPVLVFLFPLSPLRCQEDAKENLYENIATLEGMPSAIVGDAVNVITGGYCDNQTDLIAPCAHPIRIYRSYASDSKFANYSYLTGPLARAQVWQWNHGGLISLSESGSKYKACVYKGSCLSGLMYRSTEDDKHELKIRNEYYEHGLTNCHLQEISGRTHHKNTRVFVKKKKNCLVRTGAGVETHADVLFSHDPGKYRISSEYDPNGNYLKYDYQDKNHVVLTKISAYNRQKKLLDCIDILYPSEKNWKKEPIVIKTQDGRKASYYFDEGKEINRRLRRVVRSDGPEENYYYDRSSRYEERIVRKELPDGRFLSIDYSGKKGEEKSGRVCELQAPIGKDEKPHVFYRFAYHADRYDEGCGYTNVWDAHSNKKVYAHDYEKRLMSIKSFNGSTPYRTERFFWGNWDAPDGKKRRLVGNLITSLIQEGDTGAILSCRNFKYDNFGNILVDRLFGNLTGKNKTEIFVEDEKAPWSDLEWDDACNLAIPQENGCEFFEKVCTYSEAPYNLVTSENNGRSITKYQYEPDSNRLSAKLVCNLQGKIKKRHFYTYDKMRCLQVKPLMMVLQKKSLISPM